MEEKELGNGILFPKLFRPTMRKKCFGDCEKLLKFEADMKAENFQIFSKSLEIFIQTVKGQYNL